MTAPQRSDPPKKDAYLVERIQVDHVDQGAFTDDRSDQGQSPIGFHINGRCPSCNHETSALCASKYITPDGEQAEEAKEARLAYEESEVDQSELVCQVTLLRCACVIQHKTAPADTFGCGTEWLLDVIYAPDQADAAVAYYAVPSSESYKYWVSAENIADVSRSSSLLPKGSPRTGRPS